MAVWQRCAGCILLHFGVVLRRSVRRRRMPDPFRERISRRLPFGYGEALSVPQSDC